ncbi:MAG: MarR family transcriptional regulator [Pseudomonadota bacterium]|nr:MarR family transcriptional regulator [Pseudomonadota bacterium]
MENNPRVSNLFGALVVGVQDQLLHRIETESSIGGQAAAALVTIGANIGCSVDFLRVALQISHSGCVRLIDKLAETALVERRGGKDRRVVALFLTESGQRRAQRVLRTRRKYLDQVLQSLSTKEQKQLTPLLEILLKKVTTSDRDAESICRLCDEAVCPQPLCPVTQAIAQPPQKALA